MKAFSKKQTEAIKNCQARTNILAGSVRSGKTFASYFILFDAILHGITGAPLAIIGRTERTIKRNIIDPIMDLVGRDAVYKPSMGELHLWGRKIHVIGANDERAEAKIRGSEFVFCLIDELTLMPENFIKMLMSRINIDGARIVATTNPDSPHHWVYKDLICNKDIDIKIFNFVLDDNPILSEKFKREISKEYTGFWKRRFIYGEWVQAEGAVFDFFDNEIHVIDFPPGEPIHYIVGIDYGTVNPTAFTMIGYNPSLYPNMWVEREYYYDSKEHRRQKTDSEYAEDLTDFIKGFYVNKIYIDPSAASFKTELRRHNISGVLDADNNVLDGVRHMSKLLMDGTLKICSTCNNLIKEISTYVWDEKAVLRGDEKPVKKNDHLIDSLRYALTPFIERTSTMTEEEARDLERKYYVPF